MLIDIAEANPNEADAKAAVEAEIERYARVFWTLNSTDMGVVVSEMKEKNSKSSVTIPTPTEAEMKTLVNGYKAQLYERLYPVTQSVSVYMQRKAEAAYLAALNEVKEFFNQSITFNIVEDVPDGEKSQYDGYALRFAPLSENAVKESWSGAMKGTGGASTKFTLLGYVQAGCPKELQLFKPGDDPESDEPELTLGFKLSAPVTEVTLGGGLSIDEVVGTYDIVITDDAGDTVEESARSFSKNENGQLIEDTNVYNYDQATGTATYSFENSIGLATVTFIFTSENGRIHVSGLGELIAEEGTVRFYYDGYKAD